MKMMNKSDILFDIIVNVMAAVIILMIAYPLLFVISASFSDPIRVLNGEMWLLPKGFTLESYHKIIGNQSIWLGYRNSLFYVVVGTTINLLFTTLAAYPLSRKTLPGRNAIMLFITFTMFFSGGIIPTYLLVKSLGLTNTIWALMIPNAIATYNLIVMRTYFQTNIPDELLESAEIDGCSNMRTFISIVLPLAKPIVAVMVLFYGVAHWNAFFNALIYIRNSKLYPLQVFLRDILLQNKFTNDFDNIGSEKAIFAAEGIKYALIIVASVPVLLLYPFVQKYFVKGIMVGALKG